MSLWDETEKQMEIYIDDPRKIDKDELVEYLYDNNLITGEEKETLEVPDNILHSMNEDVEQDYGNNIENLIYNEIDLEGERYSLVDSVLRNVSVVKTIQY